MTKLLTETNIEEFSAIVKPVMEDFFADLSTTSGFSKIASRAITLAQLNTMQSAVLMMSGQQGMSAESIFLMVFSMGYLCNRDGWDIDSNIDISAFEEE